MMKPIDADALSPIRERVPLGENMTAARKEIELADLVRRVVARRGVVLIAAVLGLVAGVAYLHVVTPTYEAEYRVTPAASSPGGYSTKASGLSGLAAIAGVSMGGPTNSATPFELYIDRLKSREIAEALANDPRIMQTLFEEQWDPDANRWREPESAFRSIKTLIKQVLGFPVEEWRPPSGADLQAYLEKELGVVKPGIKDAPITAVVLHHRDPQFARYLLTSLDRLTDNRVRTESLARATRYAAYLSAKLQTITLNEQREALSETLRQQEESIMMASSGMSYAALVVAPPTVSEKPTNPQPVSVLAASLLAGLIGGFAVAVVRPVRRREEA